MEKPAPTREEIHTLIRSRWSPRALSSRALEPAELRRLFEAARWAPSSFNEQPWRFLVARKEDEAAYERLLACVHERNRKWAQAAPVLVLSVARTRFSKSETPNRHAFHDVGLAVGQLITQATAMGLVVRQIAGFDEEAARRAYDLPDVFEPVAVLAIGAPGDPDELPADLREKESAARRRLPLEEIVFDARWDEPLLVDETGDAER
jgi:nitroreductase